MKRYTPSRIARRMAEEQWPDVQAQHKLGPGIFDFSCSGHGGVVAVLDAAEFRPEHVELARKHRKTEWVGEYGGRLITSERYTPETFQRMQDAGMQVWEVWVGEEDCDWALIALCSAVARVGLEEHWPSKTCVEIGQYARENASRWNPEFLADFEALEAVPA